MVNFTEIVLSLAVKLTVSGVTVKTGVTVVLSVLLSFAHEKKHVKTKTRRIKKCRFMLLVLINRLLVFLSNISCSSAMVFVTEQKTNKPSKGLEYANFVERKII